MIKDPECTPERIAEARSAYEDFKKEAKKKKNSGEEWSIQCCRVPGLDTTAVRKYYMIHHRFSDHWFRS